MHTGRFTVGHAVRVVNQFDDAREALGAYRVVQVSEAAVYGVSGRRWRGGARRLMGRKNVSGWLKRRTLADG